MTPIAGARPRSFRGRLQLAALSYAVGAAILAIALLVVHHRMRADLEQATDEFVTEQWIADEIATTVMRQVLAASVYWQTPDPALRREFRDAGDDAARHIRSYLFRDLTPEQRLQLELVKEQHQKLEVAAVRSLELAGRGLEAEAADAARDVARHGVALQSATGSFVNLREADLQRLRAKQSTTLARLGLTGGLFGVLLIGAWIIWWRYVYRRLANPLVALGKAAARIGAGDMTARVPVPDEDELADVARSFNEMSDRLGAAYRTLEDRNRKLAAAVNELHATQAELIQTEKLSALGGMLAGLAHELNNPLASVLGYAQLMEKELGTTNAPTADQLRSEFLAPIVSEATRARTLIQNLLRFSRKSSPDVEAVSLGEALSVVVGLRTYVMGQEGVSLVIDPVDDVHIVAEPQRLQQTLLNVLNNAFDALRDGSPSRGGTIRVRSVVRGDAVDVIVEDDGPGFADPGRAFEPFYTTKEVGRGTGLGLTLVHRFMEELGGSVRVENRESGGARVILGFRRAEHPAGEPAPRIPEPSPENAPGPLRVLVVEDEPPLRNLQKRLLQRAGASVTLAEGGHEARRILETAEFDLVVSDVKMPDGNGLDLYRWIEKERPNLAERVFFVTGDVGDPRLAALAAERPAQFLDKPFHNDQYLARVMALAAAGAESD